MKIFILTEGGARRGLGHIIRCIALYQAFEEHKITVQLLVNGDFRTQHILKGKNYQIIDWLRQKEKVFKILSYADAVIIDSYLADTAFYKKIAKLANLLVCIDDNNRISYPKGFVVNGNIYADELNYPRKKGIVYLLGSKYALLRKEFWRISYKKIKKKIKIVMLMFGGSDTKNLSPKVLRFLKNNYPDLDKKVIVGSCFKNKKEIMLLKDNRTEFIYNPDVKQIRQNLLSADIAISGGGQTIYELARLGLPALGVCFAGNQIRNLKAWRKTGFLDFIGWYHNTGLLKEIKKTLTSNVNYTKRLKMHRIGRRYVDGQGALRLVSKILKVLD